MNTDKPEELLEPFLDALSNNGLVQEIQPPYMKVMVFFPLLNKMRDLVNAYKFSLGVA